MDVIPWQYQVMVSKRLIFKRIDGFLSQFYLDLGAACKGVVRPGNDPAFSQEKILTLIIQPEDGHRIAFKPAFYSRPLARFEMRVDLKPR